MNKKFFVISETQDVPQETFFGEDTVVKSDVAKVYKQKETKNSKSLNEANERLKHTDGRVVVKINVESKNEHTFESGLKIFLGREFNNFNRRETQPVNAIVISAENIPPGSEILIGHNALHDTNRLFNYKSLSGEEQASDIKYFSLPESDCFAWRDSNGKLQPMRNFEFALRVYKPYLGTIVNITPATVKDVLYITTGVLKGKVVHTGKSSDYEIIYQGKEGREERVIRCRYFPNEINEREELLAISHDLTKKVNNGELLVGLSASEAIKAN